MGTGYLIVVGVDGSEGGRRALRWAADEAASRGGVVQAVIAWSRDRAVYGPSMTIGPCAEEAEQEAIELLGKDIRALRNVLGSTYPIVTEVIEGRPADVLTAAAGTANLLVLGSHGHSRIHHTVLGSVSEECIRKASCPVVVIPSPADRPQPVTAPALMG